ncbi:AfsR/SARP family transcriptional regulator [Gordonibacter pamelaeae]|uniref:AfsR/SARP family transcriptional regulator n=4 Tax=Gordonibacter pamelaeae TaxID=471189 RepID=UPI00266EFDDC|nr:BTAD domain-containing putative transcriptional regulator [Gordonibacter pamelaeae]
MTGFLKQSSCKGHRPNHLASRRHYPRPDLIARLLRERHVARFLVAPEGFGKTGLAMEYADVVFSFDHVFWINGKSPCFLRDLDRGIIVSSLTAADATSFLAVVEDVPPLDAARAAALSGVFDELLGRGCEVLATCAPSCDAYGPLQHDRLKLSAADLLLADAELDAARPADDRAARPAAAVPPTERVPGLVWGPVGGEGSFLEDALREELPADLLLAMATMLVLGRGSLSDVEAFGPCGEDLAALMATGYPYLGIDRRCERFETPCFPVEAVAGAVGGKLDVLAARSHLADRDALAGRWTDVLLSRAQGERACDLVAALCSRGARAAWLAERSRTLMRQACVLPAHRLHASLGPSVPSGNAQLELGEAVRLAVLGDLDAALAAARRIASDLGAPAGIRALAALVVVREGKGSARKRAREELARLAGPGDTADVVGTAGRGGAVRPDPAFWRPLAQAQLALLDDPAWLVHGAAAAAEGRLSTADGDALALAAAWALAEVAEGRGGVGAADAEQGAAALSRIDRYVRKRLAGLEGQGDLFAAAAGLALERVRERGILPASPALRAAEALALHRAEMELFSQRRAFERSARESAERRAERAATRPDAYLDGRYLPKEGRAPTMVPLLTVNLFGGLDVRIGDTPVDPGRFRRQKVKTLLTLLVLNRGREFPRDRLVGIMWPESETDSARKNFYSVWSHLRRALSGPSGACPYLVRQQNGCRLDERLIVTDVARFDTVCRMLLFGQPGADGWAQLYAEIDEAFADDLMPSEQDNEFVVQARKDRRMQLVDALVAAADRLVAADDAQEGLWFARAALRRDRTREDAYTALMRAQIAAGQRTAALETYFECRRFLTTELGIDPSLATMELYRSIIETEELLE